MQMRATAFLTRCIRQDSRLVSHHLMRAAMIALILYLFVMQFQLYSTRTAAGGAFAGTVILCCYWFLTLLGGIHFSTAIVEEKEEQTLPLLKMTGASAFTILVGKSLPRLAVAVLFLFVISPFLILSITLGGVLPLGLASAILSIMCYAFMLCQMGLFASVVCGTVSRAGTLTCLLWIVFELAHWWHGLAVAAGRQWFGNSAIGQSWSWVCSDLLGRLPDCTLIGNLGGTLLAFTTMDSLAPDASVFARFSAAVSEIWHLHMTFHLVVGSVFFMLSWLLFEPLTRRVESAGASGMSTRAQERMPARRVWNHAEAWKSWQHVSGGVFWFWLRAAGVPLLLFSTTAILLGAFDSRVELWACASMALGFGICLFLVQVARLFGRVLNEEIHGKTIAALVMLPRNTARTLWGLVLGLMPAVLAMAVCPVLAALILTSLAVNKGADVGDILEVVVQPWIWHFFSWVLLTLHVGLWLTTYVRHGGMLIAMALLWIVCPVVCTTSFGLFAMAVGRGGSGIEDFMQYIFPVMLILVECLICVGVQRAILRRVQEAASR